MAVKGEDEVFTVESSGDLSSDQFKFVQLDSNDQAIVVDAAGEKAIGVLESKPESQGEGATVRFDGTAKVIAAESITAGDFIASDANGEAVTATAATADTTTSTTSHDISGDQVLGQAITDADDGDVFKIQYNPQGLV